VASALAFIRDARILIQRDAAPEDVGPLVADLPAAAQVAAALAAHVVRHEAGAP
jgi:hypothetical protein